jgi:branched-chain amino acid transport system substrate-binding protein
MRLVRSSVLTVVSITAALLFTACGNGSTNADSGSTINVGQLEDQSGNLSLVGLQKYHAAQLAVDQLNAAGGLLGKKINLIAPDTQSDNTKMQQLARELVLKDKVPVIFGAQTSAEREAIRPIMDQYKQLYFYTNQYEGGVCDANTFTTGAVPEQQVATLMPYLVQKFGKRVYVIAADYNFGHLTSDWVKAITEASGGTIVGQEFIPLTQNEFSSSIARIKAAQPDILIPLLVGNDQSSFFPQWASSGIKNLPMGSTVIVAQGYEHLRFQPPAAANIYVPTNFIKELGNYLPSSKTFVDAWMKKFPNDPYIDEEAESEYDAIMLWADAVKKAGTTDQTKVKQLLGSGMSYDSPSGTVTIDPKTHAAVRDIYLAHTTETQSIEFPAMWKAVQPNWLSEVAGCDLTKKSDQTQYTPSAQMPAKVTQQLTAIPVPKAGS